MARRERNHAAHLADPSDYVRCRTLGHAWDPIPVTEPPSYGLAIDLRCIHCATIRRDIVSRSTASLMNRRYTYPDHYRDAEQHTRQDWRAMWVTTLSEALYAIGEEDEEPSPPIPISRSRRARKAS